MATSVVKYIGPFPEGVDIQVDGRWVQVPHGGTVEVSTADAKSLCEQESNWERVKDAPAKDEKK